MYKATIIEDSISPDNIRLTTMHIRYPRMVHPEFMTHRVFSRNGRSSRAVPTMTLMDEEPYFPDFMMNQPGMQSLYRLNEKDHAEATLVWDSLIRITQEHVKRLHELKVHKQWANRPLEWFGWIDILVTSTYWENFWELRRHGDAQPEIKTIADMMYETMDNSAFPTRLEPGEWHLPYVTKDERRICTLKVQKQLSTARCARLSYKPFDGDADQGKEIERYERLVVSRPVHASPAEHQATPDDYRGTLTKKWTHPEEHGNFVGWRQHRKMLPHEAMMENL